MEAAEDAFPALGVPRDVERPQTLVEVTGPGTNHGDLGPLLREGHLPRQPSWRVDVARVQTREVVEAVLQHPAGADVQRLRHAAVLRQPNENNAVWPGRIRRLQRRLAAIVEDDDVEWNRVGLERRQRTR